MSSATSIKDSHKHLSDFRIKPQCKRDLRSSRMLRK